MTKPREPKKAATENQLQGTLRSGNTPDPYQSKSIEKPRKQTAKIEGSKKAAPESESQEAKKTANTNLQSPKPLDVWEYLTYLLPRLKDDPSVPVWPPDVFGLCMSLLCKSGSYCRILENWPPPPRSSAKEWGTMIAQTGKDWRTMWPNSVPDLVRERWQVVLGAWEVPVESVRDKIDLVHALLELCAAADESAEGLWLPGSPGTPGARENKSDDEAFFGRSVELQYRSGIISTLCSEIDRSRLIVLPKCRTPQNGLTSRSLSHHLALSSCDEIKPRWVNSSYGDADKLTLNFLIVPWPPEVRPVQFTPASPLQTEAGNMPPNFSFFTYKHTGGASDASSQGVRAVVADLYAVASKKLGKIDAVVLPEAALTKEEHKGLSEDIVAKESFLISGVASSSNTVEHGENKVYVDFPMLRAVDQHKHHRWKLDESQIWQYGLGSRLYPQNAWWEHISLGYRRITFVAVSPWLVMSVLICEDLARPDPVGDLVRTVGPNLVIALLMDGPQLKERWGARYATTLADDPGSSVLTVTSAGMCGLSRPAAGTPRSRVIALWKDAKGGPMEIELPEGQEGVVLSLSVRTAPEWTADGRQDSLNAGYPVLSGIHCVSRDVK